MEKAGRNEVKRREDSKRNERKKVMKNAQKQECFNEKTSFR